MNQKAFMKLTAIHNYLHWNGIYASLKTLQLCNLDHFSIKDVNVIYWIASGSSLGRQHQNMAETVIKRYRREQIISSLISSFLLSLIYYYYYYIFGGYNGTEIVCSWLPTAHRWKHRMKWENKCPFLPVIFTVFIFILLTVCTFPEMSEIV